MELQIKKIVLVDDHVILRNGLKELIEKLGPYRVIEQYDNGNDLLNAFPMNSEPDLIVMDVCMPQINGDQVMELLYEKKIEIPVLILTFNEDEAVIIKLFRSGARGYLKKNSTATMMTTALNDIFEKGYYHNEFLTYSLRNNIENAGKTEQEIILERFSERERTFLKLVCDTKELTYEQIADRMCVQPRTVDGYRESIFEKFKIKSKTGLVLFVMKYKLIDFL